jgi:hypothetical protein
MFRNPFNTEGLLAIACCLALAVVAQEGSVLEAWLGHPLTVIVMGVLVVAVLVLIGRLVFAIFRSFDA